MISLLVPALLLCIASVVYGRDAWIGPLEYAPQVNWERNAVWPLGTQQTLTWTTTYQNYRIEIWQHDVRVDGPKNTALGTIFNSTSLDGDPTGQQSFEWTVTLDLKVRPNLDISPVFWVWTFELGDDGTTGESFSSYSFNITREAATSTSSSTATASTLTTSTLSSTTSASTTGPGSTTSNHGNGDDTSLTLKVGLGVGLGLGVPLLLVIGALVGYRVFASRRKTSSGDQQDGSTPHQMSEGHPGNYYQDQYEPLKEPLVEVAAHRSSEYEKNHQGGDLRVHEMNAVPGRAELGGSEGVL